MKDLFTIIYYTSNREDEAFEAKVRRKLLEVKGDIPIISISHKPIDFGKNICIGEHEPSNVLIYKQILLGCKAAVSPFIISAEADFLYCPEYFAFIPPKKDKIYRYHHIGLLWKHHWGFFRKLYSEGAQIAGREYLISLFERRLEGASEGKNKFDPYRNLQFEMFGGENYCLTFKTGQALHKATGVLHTRSWPAMPPWGTAEAVRKEMFNI